MCQTKSHPSNKQENSGRPTRSCRWLSTDVASRLANGEMCLLRVVVDGKADGYFVERLGQGTWRMTKEDPATGEPLEPYIVTTHGEVDLAWWTCGCKGYFYRKPAGGCRHIAALNAACRAVGVDPLA